MKTKKSYVNSVKSYIDTIEIKKVSAQKCCVDSSVLFYRGHNNIRYELLPGAYRVGDGVSFRGYEYDIYQEILHRIPSSFLDDKTILERLVRMQHYGIPTRLLDVTTNPLVALYFACAPCTSKIKMVKADGQVLILHTKNENVTYSSGVSSISTSGLDVKSESIQKVFLSIYERIKIMVMHSYWSMVSEYMKKYKKEIDKNFMVIQDYDKLFRIIHKENNMNIEEIKEAICEIEKIFLKMISEASKHLLDRINNTDFIINDEYHFFSITCIKDLQKLRNEAIKCLYSLIGIDSKDTNMSINDIMDKLSNVTFIYPHKNNERIVRQHGFFLLFPPYYSASEKCPNETILDSIFIKKNEKQPILEELSSMGIDEAYLFPELDVQARHVKAMFAKKA